MDSKPRPAGDDTARTPRRPWQPPTLRAVGTVADVLRGGTNKVTVVTGDPGEPQKVPGNDY